MIEIPQETVMSPVRVIGAVLLQVAIIGGSACAKKEVRFEPELPPLEMPAAPPRNVELTEPEAQPLVGLVEEPARSTPNAPSSKPRSQPAPPRADTNKPEAPKPDSPAVESKPANDDASRTPPAASLQPGPTQREVEMEQEIRRLLVQTASSLNRIDYRNLDTNARGQYDQAKRFASQAEDAIKGRNFVYALNLADKANTLAAQLGGR
jgi:hypothetical protein